MSSLSEKGPLSSSQSFEAMGLGAVLCCWTGNMFKVIQLGRVRTEGQNRGPILNRLLFLQCLLGTQWPRTPER